MNDIWIDILFFVGGFILMLFGFDILKKLFSRWIPSEMSFNEGTRGIAASATDERLSIEMVGLKAIVDAKGGGFLP